MTETVTANKFAPKWTGRYDASWNVVNAWKIAQYPGTTSSVVESNQIWDSKVEAQAAADRANAGNEEGLTFSSYADD